MFKLLRLAVCLCCLCMLVLGVVAFNPAGRLVSSFRGNSSEKLPLGEELRRKENLKETENALRRCREAKWHIAEEIIERRLSLAEAMQRFQAMDRDCPPGRAWVAESLGITEDEADGQGVLIYVQFVLQSRQEATDAVLGRLEKELQELRANRKKRPAAPDEPRSEPRR